MATNISSLLQKGNLTPKERALLVVHNNVNEERAGKSLLTEAEKYALIQGWTPKDNDEAVEYNKYNSGWRTAGMAELDAQTTFLQTQVFFYKRQFIFMLNEDNKISLKGERMMDEVYRLMRADLITGYGTLLAFKEMFDRLSKTYEIDLTYKINDWLSEINSLITQHNFFIAENAGQADIEGLNKPVGDKGLDEFSKQLEKTTNKTLLGLVIDTDKIKPDKTRAGGYFTEFEKILGKDF